VLTAEADGTAQRTIGRSVSAKWWELFHVRALDEVVRQAIAGNQTLAVAEATLAEAQEAVRQARAAFYPQLDFGASFGRQKSGGGSSASAGSGAINLYSLGPTVSYALDVFGGTRRRVEQQAALEERQDYELAAAYLTLTGNAVAQAINVASARMQLDAAESIIADDERNLGLVRQKLDAGKAAEVDVLSAESQLANDRTQIPPLRQQLSTARHALAILVGRFPGEWSPPDFELADFTLPEELPVSLPSELVHQRPDILAAEAQLHADSAAVGVAVAQMYPTITLSASVSAEALSSNAVFPGVELGVGHAGRHGGAGLSRRRSRGAAARCDRRVSGLPRDVSRDRSRGFRPSGGHPARARARCRARGRRTARVRCLQRLAGSAATQLRGRQVGPAAASRRRAPLAPSAARIRARARPALPGHHAIARRDGRRLVERE
jgi:NodT family efflux transporter outer membrane factor (OMF) lipoprotein